MTRAEIIAALQAIERQLADRLVITHVIVDPDGHVVKRISHVVTMPTLKKGS